MLQITVRYGFSQQTVALNAGSRFADLKANAVLRMELGYGDNVRFLMNGVEMPLEASIPNGAFVTVETAANTKALPVLA